MGLFSAPQQKSLFDCGCVAAFKQRRNLDSTKHLSRALRNSAPGFLHQHHLWSFIFKAETLLARKPLSLSGFALNGQHLRN